MARNLGPKHKNCRRFGMPLCGSQNCPALKKNYPPGQHGVRSAARRKISDYKLQLVEKQKTKAIYGLLEKQFRKYFEMATKSRVNTGEKLLQFLETRLDNVIYRLGFAKTRSFARQLVSHGHILVNDKKVDIPSYQVKSGDIVSIKPETGKNPQIIESLNLSKNNEIPAWLDKKGPIGKIVKMPERAEIGEPITEHLIVEFYSR